MLLQNRFAQLPAQVAFAACAVHALAGMCRRACSKMQVSHLERSGDYHEGATFTIAAILQSSTAVVPKLGVDWNVFHFTALSAHLELLIRDPG